jgi:hypothetical protein
MKSKNLFCIFGIFQAITLGLIIFFILQTTSVGRDTSIVLSILFPLFTLIVEYIIYSKNEEK